MNFYLNVIDGSGKTQTLSTIKDCAIHMVLINNYYIVTTALNKLCNRGRLFERRLAERWISQNLITLSHILRMTESTSYALNMYFRRKLNYSH